MGACNDIDFFCELTLDLKQQAEGYEVIPALILDYIDGKNIAVQFVLLFSVYNVHIKGSAQGRMMKPLCQRSRGSRSIAFTLERCISVLSPVSLLLLALFLACY